MAKPAATKLSYLEVSACCGCLRGKFYKYDHDISSTAMCQCAMKLYKSFHVDLGLLYSKGHVSRCGALRGERKGTGEKGRAPEEFPFVGYPMIFFWMAD